MARVDLHAVRIAVTGVADEVHVGTLADRQTWRHHVDRSSDFAKAVLDWCGPGCERDIITPDGARYVVSVRATAGAGEVG